MKTACCVSRFGLSVANVLTDFLCNMQNFYYSNQRVMNFEDKISDRIKQQICIEFCVKLGEYTRDIVNMISRAFGAAALSDRTTRRWCLFFQQNANANARITDQPRRGRPRTARTPANQALVQQQLQQDQTQTVRRISMNTNVAKDTVHRILKVDLQLKKRVAKFIPHILNNAQRAAHLQICQHWNRVFNALCNWIMTIDETYIHCYDPKTRHGSMEWLAAGVNRPQKALHERTVWKLLLTVFWDSNGVIFRHFLPENTHMTAVCYVWVLRLFKRAVRRR